MIRQRNKLPKEVAESLGSAQEMSGCGPEGYDLVLCWPCGEAGLMDNPEGGLFQT